MRWIVLCLLVSLPSCCFGGGAPSAASPSLPALAPAREPVRSDVPAALDGASLTMGELTLNGQTLRDVSCTGEMNLFGGNPAGTLAEQGPAMRACVPGGASPRVHFAFANGAVSDVRVAAVPDGDAGWCVADLVTAMHPPGTGACVATVVLAP